MVRAVRFNEFLKVELYEKRRNKNFSQGSKINSREFPSCPVVRTPCFHCRGTGLISAWKTKISQAALVSL